MEHKDKTFSLESKQFSISICYIIILNILEVIKTRFLEEMLNPVPYRHHMELCVECHRVHTQ